jgi:hypothetical protein
MNSLSSAQKARKRGNPRYLVGFGKKSSISALRRGCATETKDN